MLINVPSPKSHVNLAVLLQFTPSPISVSFSNSIRVFIQLIFGTLNEASEGSKAVILSIVKAVSPQSFVIVKVAINSPFGSLQLPLVYEWYTSYP